MIIAAISSCYVRDVLNTFKVGLPKWWPGCFVNNTHKKRKMNKEIEESMPSMSAALSLLVKCHVNGLTDAAALVGSASELESTAISRLRDHVSSIVRDCATGITVDSVLEIDLSEDLLVLQLTNDLEDVTGVPAADIRAWLATVDVDAESDETPEPEAEMTPAEPVDPSSIVFEYECGLREGDHIAIHPFGSVGTVITPDAKFAGNTVAYSNSEGEKWRVMTRAISEARRDDRQLVRTDVDGVVHFRDVALGQAAITVDVDETESEASETPAKQPYVYPCGLQAGDRVDGLHEKGRLVGTVWPSPPGHSPFRVCVSGARTEIGLETAYLEPRHITEATRGGISLIKQFGDNETRFVMPEASVAEFDQETAEAASVRKLQQLVSHYPCGIEAGDQVVLEPFTDPVDVISSVGGKRLRYLDTDGCENQAPFTSITEAYRNGVRLIISGNLDDPYFSLLKVDN